VVGCSSRHKIDQRGLAGARNPGRTNSPSATSFDEHNHFAIAFGNVLICKIPISRSPIVRECEHGLKKRSLPTRSTGTDHADGEYSYHDAGQRLDDPFWNSSQTNFPRPGFCANISAAIKTIQPTPSDKRNPVSRAEEG
jgi:hypothetical protein